MTPEHSTQEESYLYTSYDILNAELNMGASNSKQHSEPICIDCDKKTQKDLPSDNSSSASNDCKDEYARVTACMSEHKGQIGPCTEVWDSFKECHARNAKQR